MVLCCSRRLLATAYYCVVTSSANSQQKCHSRHKVVKLYTRTRKLVGILRQFLQAGGWQTKHRNLQQLSGQESTVSTERSRIHRSTSAACRRPSGQVLRQWSASWRSRRRTLREQVPELLYPSWRFHQTKAQRTSATWHSAAFSLTTTIIHHR